MSELTQASSALSVWQTELLRLTIFPNPPLVLSQGNWWSELVGDEPEASNAQPRSGRLTQLGNYKDGQLGLVIQPDRIDWNYTAIEDEPSSEGSKNPSIGDFPHALEIFREVMHRWLNLPSSPIVGRLAFGAILSQPVDNLASGYELLSHKYLPFPIDTQGTSDFIYRINKQTTSQVGFEDLQLNRLRNWSVSSRQNFIVSIIQGQATSIPSPFPQMFSIRLELDINTSPDFVGELNRELLPELFDELIHLGAEIAEKGDKP
jgi:hypothetical protein